VIGENAGEDADMAACKAGLVRFPVPPKAQALPGIDSVSRNSYHISMTAIVSEKGQVTIPKALRERLGLGPGQVLDFREEKGCLVAEKAPDRDAVSSVYGILQPGRGTDSLMRELRGGDGPQ